MISVIIIDDNVDKVNSIVKVLTNSGILYDNIEYASNVIDAKNKLRVNQYDLALLDICLPQRKDERPRDQHGIKFFDDIINKDKYKKPKELIGITEYADIFENVKQKFDENIIHIIKYDELSNSWKERLFKKIRYLIHQAVVDNTSDSLLVIVHGIRTYGDWQERLQKMLNEEGSKYNILIYKYNYFNIFFYCSLLSRYVAARMFSSRLKKILESEGKKKISFVSHSFGTFIVSNAIKILSKNENIIIDKVIFSGSVLPETYRFDKHLSCVNTIVNDCSYDDDVLLFNFIFVPFAGMAGRRGFIGFKDKIINRYFSGGHSTFFYDNGKSCDKFMKDKWLPILLSDLKVNEYDERPNQSFINDFYYFIFFLSIIKNIIYIIFIPVVAILLYIYT